MATNRAHLRTVPAPTDYAMGYSAGLNDGQRLAHITYFWFGFGCGIGLSAIVVILVVAYLARS